MLLDFQEWIVGLLAGQEFSEVVGTWIESNAEAGSRYCAVMAAGGPAATVQVRRPRFQVILLGKRGNPPGETQAVLAGAETISDIVVNTSGPWPCGAANVQLVGELTGPGFTEENRPWVRLDFQVIF